jgi:DNA polymerase III epsilon subunit family exonuclease
MKAFVFDTETTGLIQNRKLPLDKQPHIIEVFGHIIDLKTGDVLEEFETLVRPPVKLAPIITKITGLTDEKLAEAPPFSKVFDGFRKIVGNAPVIIAHNLSFDTEMCEIEFERLGEKIEWPRKVCTVEQTIHMKRFRLSLTNLYDTLFNEKFEGAHRARHDVVALSRCCVELYRRKMI